MSEDLHSFPLHYVLTRTHRDPSIKRTICKRCDAILLPGITDEVRVKGECDWNQLSARSAAEQRPHLDFKPTVRAIRHRCLLCGFVRQLPAPPLQSAPSKPAASSSSAHPRQSATEPQTAAADIRSSETAVTAEQVEAHAPSKKSKKRRRRNQKVATKHGLVPYHERMEGSGWADHLKLGPTGASSSDKEKIAAKRHKGGHVLLQSDGIHDDL